MSSASALLDKCPLIILGSIATVLAVSAIIYGIATWRNKAVRIAIRIKGVISVEIDSHDVNGAR